MEQAKYRSSGAVVGRRRWCCGCCGGQDLGEVSREVQVSPPELEEWRRVFLETGEQGLKRRSRDPTERELIRTRAKLGEVTMRMELAKELFEKRGYGDELKKLLKRGRE